MNLHEINNLAEDPSSVSMPIKVLVFLGVVGFILFMDTSWLSWMVWIV